MGKHIVRPARMEEAAALAEIKSRYVKALFRGFLSAEYLKGLHETYFLPEVRRWLEGEYQVDVLEIDGKAEGFVTYGQDPDDASRGFILEVGIMPSGSWLEKDILMRSCMDKLAEKYEIARVQTVKDNFRARFLFEQFGFRSDGTQRLVTIDGTDLRIIRLICRLPQK
ncbi:MAG: GNAT family N-acetyltransferase [Clostridia bacterium]|nr:GNAT family N-acetyltransferase [Clostridia bacterium]